MTVSERGVGRVTLLDLDGRLILGASAEALRDKVRSLLQQGRTQFIVNLAGVPCMDSGGLGEPVQAYTTVTRQGTVGHDQSSAGPARDHETGHCVRLL
jgi:anti-anti-sigma factor